MGTVIVGAVVFGIMALALKSIVRDRKKGKSLQCGKDCSKCKGCH